MILARTESDVFSDLARLCVSDGYVHALAYICFANDVLLGSKPYEQEEDDSKPGSLPELTRTEIMTLVGLLVKEPIKYDVPSHEELERLVTRTHELLRELHQALRASDHLAAPESTISRSGLLRESIFYSGDSAYHFQYSQFAPLKYGEDAEWLLHQKGVDLEVGRAVMARIRELYEQRRQEALAACQASPPNKRTLLGAFRYSQSDLGLGEFASDELAASFVDAFTLPPEPCNAGFTSVDTFNEANACPIIRSGPDEFTVFSVYQLTQAFFETPFYWLHGDDEYRDTAADHRGAATESITAKLLARVFSVDRVFSNVQIIGPNDKTLGEIDVLVVYGNHAIIVQAKAKKLTIEARRGNVNKIEADFRRAIISAADQAHSCAQWIGKPGVTLQSGHGRSIPAVGESSYKIPVVVLLDHYPALLFQTRLMLKKQSCVGTAAPFVTDIFALDTMAELLESPLHFLHYVMQRERHPNLIQANQEHELLSLYLQQGLAFAEEVTLVQVMEDVAGPVDLAMFVRRDGAHGPRCPQGLMDDLEDSLLGRMIADIVQEVTADAVSMALVLLDAAHTPGTIQDVDRKVEKCMQRVAVGEKYSVYSFFLSHVSAGVTIMCASKVDEQWIRTLEAWCNVRKYQAKANRWVGLLLGPSGAPRIGYYLSRPWEHNEHLESVVNDPRCP